MSNPLENDKKDQPDLGDVLIANDKMLEANQRRDTASKLLPVLDVIYALLGAVLAVFGRRKLDRE